MFRVVTLFVFLIFSFGAGAQFQGLVVNEFSQGDQGSREYIEILVVGNRTCTDSTADLRGWILDDQNGWYWDDNGAAGHYRFKNVATWEKVPFGSIILLYNAASGSKNLSITLPDDPTDSNNDLTYILPINSPALLEEHDNEPVETSGSTYQYPLPSSTTGYGGATNTWISHIALNNNGDVICLVSPGNRSSAFFSINYGITIGAGYQTPGVSIPNVTGGNNAYLSTAGFFNPADWVISPVPANETPGLPNGGANTAWIMRMRQGRPEISTSAQAQAVCFRDNAQQTTLAYTSARNSPTHYSISWDASPPNNFVAVANAALPAGSVLITVPGGTPAGTYTGYLSVQNNSGLSCSTDTFTVTVLPLPVAPLVSATQPDCITATGSIQVTALTAGHTYSIDGINYTNTSGEFLNLAPGTYFVTSRSSEGCISITTQAVINPSPGPPTVQVNSPVICPGDMATIAATVLPPDNYTYLWTVPAGAPNPGSVASFTSNVAGTYSVMITHANGCSATASGTLSINNLATVVADNKQLCAGGAITLTGQPAGGVWSGAGVSGSQFDATGLASGNYTVTYTYTSGSCSGSANAVITINPLPAAPAISVSNQCNGTSLLTASNYSGSLLWSTGATSSPITVSIAGNYTLTQTVNGCTSSAAVAFANPLTAPATPMIVSLQQPDCTNRTGSFTVASSGTGITYTIDALSMVSTTGLFSNLSPGTYSVTARSSEGCVSPAMFINILPAPPVPPMPTVQVAQPDCNGTRGAVGVLSPIGAGLQYSINSTTYQSSPLFSNLAPGNYSVSVRNSEGCISREVPVQILPASGIVSSNMTACIAEGGSYNFNGQLLMSTGNYSTTYVRTNNCDSVVRLYLLVTRTEVQRTAGCGRVIYNGNTYLAAVTLRDTISSLVTNCDSIYRVTQITVHPEPVSNLTVCLPAGQTYHFNGQALANSGRYTATFATANGCDSTVTLFLTVASRQTQTISACGTAVLNGVPYTSDTTLTERISSRLTGCDSIIRVTNIVVTPKPSLVVSSGTTICKGESVKLGAAAGNATVAWQGFGAGNEITVTPAVTTTYTAVATSVPGCSTTASVTIRVDDLDLQLAVAPSPVIAGQTITVKSGASSPYQVVRWAPAFSNATAMQQVFVADSSMVVGVWARSPGGCLDSALVQIVVDPLGDVYIPNAFTPNGDGKNDQFVVGGGSFKTFGLKVFNRWGEMIFSSAERSRGWDGITGGKPAPMGTYVYVLTATLKDGRVVERKGTVTLIR